MLRSAARADLRSVTGSSASASSTRARFFSRFSARSASRAVNTSDAGGEEHVLRGAEPLPQRVLDVAAGPAGGLPLGHQVAVGAGGVAPLLRGRELLGLLDELLLALAVASPRCSSSSAKCARRRLSKAVRAWLNRFHSASSALRSRRGAFFHSSSSSRSRSPDRFQSEESAQPLGLGDDPLLGDCACVAGLGPGRLGALAALVDQAVDGVQPGEQRGEVADRVGIGDRLAQVGRASWRRPSAATPPDCSPLLQQGDLPGQLVVLAAEVGQCLVARRHPGRSRPAARRRRCARRPCRPRRPGPTTAGSEAAAATALRSPRPAAQRSRPASAPRGAAGRRLRGASGTRLRGRRVSARVGGSARLVGRLPSADGSAGCLGCGGAGVVGAIGRVSAAGHGSVRSAPRRQVRRGSAARRVGPLTSAATSAGASSAGSRGSCGWSGPGSMGGGSRRVGHVSPSRSSRSGS